jgi:acetyl esterase/lipase
MIDPELAALADVLPVVDLNDIEVARAAFEQLITSLSAEIPGIDTLEIEDRLVPGHRDDPDVPVRVYRPMTPRNPPVPGVLYIHGGGFMIGSVEAEHAGAALMAIDSGAVVVSVDYRLAPEHPYPAGLHDCYAALTFLHAEAGALGVDPARVAVVGASAGGGLSAATALLARDLDGPPLCFQMLQIPELDDRLDTPSMQAFVDSPVWNRPLADISWRAYLGELSGARDVPVYAAPARASDLSGLPPAYISTAENDPLRDEGIIYAMRLLQAGISVELHQFPGTFHGSAMVTTASVSKRAAREAAVVLRKALGVEREGATASG